MRTAPWNAETHHANALDGRTPPPPPVLRKDKAGAVALGSWHDSDSSCVAAIRAPLLFR